VGDPFKDTSGPSLNILIKLMSIVSLVIAPVVSTQDGDGEPVPRDNWELWWVALIIAGVLLILGWVYLTWMARYGEIHDIYTIGKESERRRAERAGAAVAVSSSDHKEPSGGGDVGDDDIALEATKPKKGTTQNTPLLAGAKAYGST